MKLLRNLTNVFKLVVFGMAMTMAMAACSGDSGNNATAPTAPTGVAATAGNAEVVINWAPVAGATSYNIYYSTTTGVTKTTGTKIAGAVSPKAVTALTNGTPYFFVVTAVNAIGESAVSSQVTATPAAGLPAPAAPGGVTATAGNSQVTVSWNAVTGATSYNIYYATTAGVTTASPTKVVGAVSPRIVTTLTNNTPYFFVVTAVNSNGESVVSSEVTATPVPTPPPAAPTGVTATAGNGQVTVSWSAVTSATSYNIYYSTTSGVTKASPTNVIGAASPRIITPLVNGTPYFFVVTAVNSNGESAESSQVSATPVAPAGAFSQADLTGNWYFMQFFSGPNPGWRRGTATIDASGNITINTILDSAGSTTPPPAGTITETIDANGVVTEGGVNGAGPGNHAFMAANKQIVVGTQSSGGSQALRIFVKQVGSFSSADISSGSFAYNQLITGTNNGWQIGTGTINASQQISFASTLDNTGSTAAPPANSITMAITTSGIITNSGTSAEPTFQGVMTADKKLIIGTESNAGGSYKLRFITIGGQTFSTADLAGIWKINYLNTSPLWVYSTDSFDSAGVDTPLSYRDSTGSTALPPGATLSVSSTGLITSGSPSFHGVMAFNKNFLVGTSTASPGVFGMTIGVR